MPTEGSYEELTVGTLKDQLKDLPDNTRVRVALHEADYEKKTIEVVGERQVYAVDVIRRVVYIGVMKNKLDEGLFE